MRLTKCAGFLLIALLAQPALAQKHSPDSAVSFPIRPIRLPDVPTIQEQGLDGYEFGNWHGLFAPRGTPEKIVRAIHRDVVRILESKDTRDIVVSRGNEIIANSPDEFAARLKRDVPRYRKIMAEAGIQPQ
jgi:tripartite-type tricarboxylate transporter receptor subunit TctC